MPVVPDGERGRGCWGERGSMKAHAAVPGSSEPSGQSQVLSLMRSRLSRMEASVMQVKSDFAGA